MAILYIVASHLVCGYLLQDGEDMEHGGEEGVEGDGEEGVEQDGREWRVMGRREEGVRCDDVKTPHSSVRAPPTSSQVRSILTVVQDGSQWMSRWWY